MKEAIDVLEKKIKDLQEGIAITRKLLRRKPKKGMGWLNVKFKAWDKIDKERIVVIKKAIRVLSNPSNIG